MTGLHKAVSRQMTLCDQASNACCLPGAKVDVALGNYGAEKPLREEVDVRHDAVKRVTFSR